MNQDQFSIEILSEFNLFRDIYGLTERLNLVEILNNEAQNHAICLASKDMGLEYSQKNGLGEILYFYQDPNGNVCSAKSVAMAFIDEHKVNTFKSGEFSQKKGYLTELIDEETKSLGIGISQARRGAWYVVWNFSHNHYESIKRAENISIRDLELSSFEDTSKENNISSPYYLKKENDQGVLKNEVQNNFSQDVFEESFQNEIIFRNNQIVYAQNESTLENDLNDNSSKFVIRNENSDNGRNSIENYSQDDCNEIGSNKEISSIANSAIKDNF